MIRFLLRTLGLILLATAFVFLIVDGTKSIGNQRLFPPVLTSLNETWTVVDASSLQRLEPRIKGLSPWLWDPVALAILNAPTFVVLGAIGAVLVLLGRRRKPLIGYAR
jgi:hypothetical protein